MQQLSWLYSKPTTEIRLKMEITFGSGASHRWRRNKMKYILDIVCDFSKSLNRWTIQKSCPKRNEIGSVCIRNAAKANSHQIGCFFSKCIANIDQRDCTSAHFVKNEGECNKCTPIEIALLLWTATNATSAYTCLLSLSVVFHIIFLLLLQHIVSPCTGVNQYFTIAKRGDELNELNYLAGALLDDKR